MPILDTTTIADAQAAHAELPSAATQSILQASTLANTGNIAEAAGLLARSLPLTEDPRLLFLGFQFFFRTAIADGAPPEQRAARLSTAEHLVRRRMAVVEAACNQPALARAHTNLGLVLHYQNRLADAEVHYNRAIELDRAANYPRGLARSLGNLGNFYETRVSPPAPADLAAAEALYHQAIEFALACGAADIAAGLIANMGDIHAARADTQAARALWQQALDLIADGEHKARAHCEQRLRETA